MGIINQKSEMTIYAKLTFIVALLLAFMMAFSLAPYNVFAAQAVESTMVLATTTSTQDGAVTLVHPWTSLVG